MSNSAAVSGQSGKIIIGATTVAEVRNWSLRRRANTMNTTSMDSGGHRELKHTIKEWGGEFETIKFLDIAGTQAVGSFYVDRAGASGSTPIFSGTILITEAPAEVPYENEVAYRHTFEGSGPCTVAIA